MSPTVQILPIRRIKADERLQMRVKFDDDHIDDLVEALAEGKLAFGSPPVVFQDDSDYWLADGFHRLAAHKKAGLIEMRCLVRTGSFRDALRYSLGANQHNALKRSNADKRKAVMSALADNEIALMSNRQIADLCGVSKFMVNGMRDELTGIEFQSTERLGRDGRTIDTAKIGKTRRQDELTGIEFQSTQQIDHDDRMIDTADIDEILHRDELTGIEFQSTQQIDHDDRKSDSADGKTSAPQVDVPVTPVEPIEKAAAIAPSLPEQPLQTDPFGRPLTENVVGVFVEDRAAILSMAEHLEDLKVTVKMLRNSPGGKHIAVPLIDYHFCAAQKQLEVAALQAVCPECGASGDRRQEICKTCDGSGFVGARLFQGLAPVLQAKAKAFSAKRT